MTTEVLRGWMRLQGEERGRPAGDARLEADRDLVARVTRLCATALIAANALGAAAVFGLGVYVVPSPVVRHSGELHMLNLIVFAIALPVGLVVGVLWSAAVGRRSTEWLRQGRQPTPDEVLGTLRYSLDQAGVEAVLWAAAAVTFVALNAPYSATVAIDCAIEITLGGLVTCAVTFLLSEKLNRPIIVRALESGIPEQAEAPGVGCRLVFAWAFGSAVPLVGVALLGVEMLTNHSAAHGSGGLAVLLLASLGLLAGLVTVLITARVLADPLRSLRQGLERVERGELDTAVLITDASEVGQLQAGFNRMVRGLRERDRLRDLFGRHVGEEVVAEALERGDVELGGETREAAVMFVDLIGSTRLASSREPAEVVAELNSFFAIVVDCVSLHGGWVNKFEGDAALCIFGAPTAHPDAAGSALATARALSRRLHGELDGVKAGIGVSAGPVVAGNVGAAERFEYTVIGDPVNEAARLTELAKSEPGRVLASAAALHRASPQERERWAALRSVTLRGRSAPTTVASPIERRPLAVSA